MSSEKYLEWCTVSNTVKSRLKDNSLAHTFTCGKRIRKSTKLINKIFGQKSCKSNYLHFKQCKEKILKQLTENIELIDKWDVNDIYYKSYYDSFNITLSNVDNPDFLWNYVDKMGRDQCEPEEPDHFYIWEPEIDISEIRTNVDFEKMCNVNELRRQDQITESPKSCKKKAIAKNLIYKNTVNSTNISSKEASSSNSKVTNTSAKQKRSPKAKQLSKKSLKDVKKNLTLALDDVNSRSQESAGEEWNGDFAAAEFQAQSTQIFSDTLSEKKTKSRPNIDLRLSHEVINQPRDSGIEEDSREDNAKFENPFEKKDNKSDEDEKNLSPNGLQNSPNKKVPLKIIGEEMVTKKFKIISNKDKDLKPVKGEKKIQLIKSDSENSESSSVSDHEYEFADCPDADDSQLNKSDKSRSSDEYYDLQDNGSDRDSEDDQSVNKNENVLQNENNKRDSKDSQSDSERRDSEPSENENENENVLQHDGSKQDFENSQNEHETKNYNSDSSSKHEFIINKKELKEDLRKCKSPFMIRRYKELKRSGVLDESDTDSEPKLIKTSEKTSQRTLIKPLKSSTSKKTSQMKADSLKNIPETEKEVNDKSFEEKTLVAEDFNDNSVLTNGLKGKIEDFEDDIEEVTPNIAKLQQIKRLNLSAGNDESDDSEFEKADDVEKENIKSPNSKQYHRQMKKVDAMSNCEDFDKTENESKDNTIKSNTLNRKKEKMVSSKKESVQIMLKSNEVDSDSIVSETTNSETSLKLKQCSLKNEKSKVPKKVADKDKDTSSAHENSVEIDTQNDLKNVIKNYKQSLLVPKSTEDLNESEETADIGTQLQPKESSDHDDSDDSENSEVDKTLINMQNQSKIKEKELSFDSKKKNDSLKTKSFKDDKIKQKAMALKESSSKEDTSDSEELEDDTFNATVNKNEDSEDECTMSSQAKENLNKIKRLDLLNSDEDSDESEDGIAEKNRISDMNNKEQISDKSDAETTTACKSSKSKSKHSPFGITSFTGSGSESLNIDDKSLSSNKNKNKYKRKFTQIDSEDVIDKESATSLEVDVVHYSSDNDLSDQRKNKKLKSSNFGASAIDEEENTGTLSPNSFKTTKLDIILSESGSDDSDSDQVMSHSSKQKILRLQKMNLLANSSSSSSEDEETIESSRNKFTKHYKKRASNNSVLSNSNPDSDAEEKKDLREFKAKISITNNQVEESKEEYKDDESDVEEQKGLHLNNKNSESEDSEEEFAMSSKTKERLNKMQRLDLLNNDENSDDSQDSIQYKNCCDSDIDIEEHKIEDVDSLHDLKKNSETSKDEINSKVSDSENTKTDKSKTKNSITEKSLNKNVKKNELKNKQSSTSTSPSVSVDSTEVNNVKEQDKSKKSKKSKKKDIVQEIEENVNLQKSILESQPMFSSLEDLREGIDEKQVNIDIESDVNANSLKDTSQISETEAQNKMFPDKITKISELVEKESLKKITCLSSMSIKNISADEDIFVLEVPKTMFNENLEGKPFSFSKTTLTVGNNKYEAFQRKVSPTYSCIFKTEKKALDSFTTQNIRPAAVIIAKRKKVIDESAEIIDGEVNEDIGESSINKETKKLVTEDNSLKDKSTKSKVIKKTPKKSKKSEEKEVQESSKEVLESRKKESKNTKSKKNPFDINKFVKKTTKASAADSSEKQSKKLHQKAQGLNDLLDNDEIARDENVNNNNLRFAIDAHTQSVVKKSLMKQAMNISTSQDNASKTPVKSPGKLKKVKRPTEDAKETEDAKVSGKKTDSEAVKKLLKSESKSLVRKRKAETQSNVDTNPDEKQEKKKKNATVEKKEKNPASKAVKQRVSKKKPDKQSGESAANQIKKLIAKNIKFDDSLNGSFDPSNYKSLDIERVSKKHKRCASSSSSSDDSSKFTNRSFHVRVKTKSESDKSTDTSGTVKNEDKKSVKKVFFAE